MLKIETLMIIYKDNFDGEWIFIPSHNDINNQLILTKDYCGEKITYNFNFDDKECFMGKLVSLMNVLLGLDEKKFYKRIINDNSIEFIVMNDNEIKDYKEAIRKEENKEINKN